MSFSRIQARRFRCLKQIDQPLGPFQALVGPNASGKTTFLDVLTLLRDLMRSRGDVQEAVNARSANFMQLLWMGEGTSFDVAVEARIPHSIHNGMGEKRQRFRNVRYELQIGLDPSTNELGIDRESLWLFHEHSPRLRHLIFFPEDEPDLESFFWARAQVGRRRIINKLPEGNDNYYPDNHAKYRPSYRLGRSRSALANVPSEPSNFGVALWFKDKLEKGVQDVILDSQIIRRPSPPGLGNRFKADGSNLPWVIRDLRDKNRKQFANWIEHVRTALTDIHDVRTIIREEDRHCYLVIDYENGSSVPSWLVSDGTSRLLALTIPAYAEGMVGTFLIEEPENGIHPKAMETVTQSLTSVYDGQVLIATHSPIVIDQLEPDQIICFAKNSQGATDTIAGDQHPALREWKRGRPDLGVLAASGILS